MLEDVFDSYDQGRVPKYHNQKYANLSLILSFFFRVAWGRSNTSEKWTFIITIIQYFQKIIWDQQWHTDSW